MGLQPSGLFLVVSESVTAVSFGTTGLLRHHPRRNGDPQFFPFITSSVFPAKFPKLSAPFTCPYFPLGMFLIPTVPPCLPPIICTVLSSLPGPQPSALPGQPPWLPLCSAEPAPPPPPSVHALIRWSSEVECPAQAPGAEDRPEHISTHRGPSPA